MVVSGVEMGGVLGGFVDVEGFCWEESGVIVGRGWECGVGDE